MSNYILIANFLLYLLTYIIYQHKSSSFQIGSVVLLFYTLLALGACFLYHSDSIWLYEGKFAEITVFPFIYLYIALLVSFKPLLQLNSENIYIPKFPDSIFMKTLSVIIIVIYALFLLKTLTSSLSISSMLDPATLLENYNEKVDSVGDEGPTNYLAVLKNIFSDILWIMFMYNWISGNRFLTLGLLFSIAVSVVGGLATAGRANLLSVILQMPFMYLIFRPRLSERQKKTFLITVGSVCIFAFVALTAITIGRFNNSSRYNIFQILLYYSSSNFILFNNYALDAGGCRFGDRTFPLVRLLLGFDITGNYQDRRLEFSYMELDDSQFSFFVGEFVLDYGPYFAMILLIVASIYFSKKLKKQTWDLGDILLAFFLYRIVVDGFTLFPYSEIGGNLRIIYIIIFINTFKFFTKKRIKI